MKWILSSAVVAALIVVGCGSDSSSSFQGAGSVWTADFTGSEFVLAMSESVDSDALMTVNGTFEDLDTGFRKMTVTSATGNDAPEAGDLAHGLLIPGFAFLLKPLDTQSEIIPTVIAGACPSADFNANWVIVGRDGDYGDDTAGSDWYGTFQWDQDESLPSTPLVINLNYSEVESSGFGATNCDAGVVEIEDAETGDLEARMFLTNNGGALVHTEPENENRGSIIFGAPQGEVTAANFTGNYAGLRFDGATDVVDFLTASIDADGTTITIEVLTGAETTTTDDNEDTWTVTLSEINTDADGLARASVADESDNTQNGACAMVENVAGSGKNIVSCTVLLPNNDSEYANFVLTNK